MTVCNQYIARIIAIMGFLNILMIVSVAYAQNLEEIGSEKPFKINGGLSVNQTLYSSSDSLSRRDPYNFYLTGNLNLSLYGWSVPLSFNYSNQKTTFTQPFNNYSLHPQYKWIKAHIGYTSMSFSPYSLNGHLFLGAGVELAPDGPFSLSLMAGRLKKTVEFDSSALNSRPPSFERWGYGCRIGYRLKPGDNTSAGIILNLFHAKDDPGSLKRLPDSALYPGENLVISVSTDLAFGGHYTVSAEVASSAVCKNLLSDAEGLNPRSWNRVMNKLIGPNGTTEFYSAFRFNAAYNAELYTFGIGYERIDPGYETFGAYYFNNDMQNVTLNGSLNILNEKITFSGNIGRQNDNLDNSKAGKMNRWVTAINCNFNPNERFNGSLSYSSFTSYMHIRSQFVSINELTPYDNLDTLNFTQLSSTTGLSLNYLIKNSETIRQNASFNLNHQKSSERQNNLDTLGASTFYNISAFYGYTYVPSSFTATVSFNTSLSNMPEISNTILGPSISLNKLWLDKKLKTTLTASYNKSYNNGEAVNTIMNMRVGAGYRIGKRHNLSLNMTFLNRKKNTYKNGSIREFIGALLYSMNF